MKILFLGDVFGRPGRNTVKLFLPKFKQDNHIDLCIANCENLSNGKGISEKSIVEMKNAGVNIFTSGNHLYDKRDDIEFIARSDYIARPLNYPKPAKGHEFVKKNFNGNDVMVITLCGQAFMNHSVNSPFYTLENFLMQHENLPKIIIIDFHAESTAEKRTFGFYFNGKVSAILGTHTHIQTADEQILDEGTAYITDVGMCGPHDSVIGIQKEIALEKVKTGMPVRHAPAEIGLQINAVLMEIDNNTGKCNKINRIIQKI